MNFKVDEINQIHKKNSVVQWRIGLVYPNKYKIGMSGLTVKLLYFLLNFHPNIYCERIFLPNKTDRIQSIETQKYLTDFDILAFTFQFELDYINAIKMLINSGIPPMSIDREKKPLLIAGGPCVINNPKPILDFFDMLFLGDFETIYDEFLNTIINAKFGSLVESIATIKGFYLTNDIKDGSKLNVAKVKDMNEVPYPLAQVRALERSRGKSISLQGYFLQISRGCTNRCHFCMIGNIFSPFRERSYEKVIDLIEEGTSLTKTNFVSLIGSAVADHSRVKEIIQFLNSKNYRFSIPSVRIDSGIELLEEIKKSGQWNITIAPETADEDLRQKIGKIITDNDIDIFLRKVEKVGMTQLKTYFILGLTEDPFNEGKQLLEFLENTKKQFNSIRLNVSTTPLIPKTKTAFRNRCPNYLEVEKVYKYLSKDIKSLGVKFNKFPMKWAAIQAILSIGERDISKSLLTTAQKGGSLGAWRSTLGEAPIKFFTDYCQKT